MNSWTTDKRYQAGAFRTSGLYLLIGLGLGIIGGQWLWPDKEEAEPIVTQNSAPVLEEVAPLPANQPAASPTDSRRVCLMKAGLTGYILDAWWHSLSTMQCSCRHNRHPCTLSRWL